MLFILILTLMVKSKISNARGIPTQLEYQKETELCLSAPHTHRFDW